MIRFATRIFKKPARQTIYWALEDVKRAEAKLRVPVAYRHVTRDANTVADDMARRALAAKVDVIYWNGDVPEDAPSNQLAEVYHQHLPTEQMDWTGLPPPMELEPPAADGSSTVACIFGHMIARVAVCCQSYTRDA